MQSLCSKRDYDYATLHTRQSTRHSTRIAFRKRLLQHACCACMCMCTRRAPPGPLVSLFTFTQVRWCCRRTSNITTVLLTHAQLHNKHTSVHCVCIGAYGVCTHTQYASQRDDAMRSIFARFANDTLRAFTCMQFTVCSLGSTQLQFARSSAACIANSSFYAAL